MRLLHRVAGGNFRQSVERSDIREELGVELRLLPAERSQLRCFGTSGQGSSIWTFSRHMVGDTRIDTEHAREILSDILYSMAWECPRKSKKKLLGREVTTCHSNQTLNKWQKTNGLSGVKIYQPQLCCFWSFLCV